MTTANEDYDLSAKIGKFKNLLKGNLRKVEFLVGAHWDFLELFRANTDKKFCRDGLEVE